VAFLVALGLALFVLPSPWNWVAVVVGGVIELGETWFWWWLSHRREPSVGVETLVGARAAGATPTGRCACAARSGRLAVTSASSPGSRGSWQPWTA
jgi:hypothetical protein